MEALLSRFSSLADEALEDENFDPSLIEDLMKAFEAEAERCWSESARRAELSVGVVSGERGGGGNKKPAKGGPPILFAVGRAQRKAPAPVTVTAEAPPAAGRALRL